MNIMDAMDDRYFAGLKPIIGIEDNEISYIKKNKNSKKIKYFLIALEQSFLYNNTFGYANLKIELNKLRNLMKVKGD